METPAVALTVENAVAHLRLDRPEAGNAVDAAMFDLLERHLGELRRRSDVQALVLSGVGDDFCLGRDRRPPARPPTALSMREGLRRVVDLNTSLAALPCPTIAAVQGRASGMGAGLTLQCDLTLMTPGAALGFPEIGHDLPPTIVLSYLPRHLPPKRCFELVILGRPIDAATALDWGLANRVVPEDELLPAALALAGEIAARDPAATRTVKAYLRQSRGQTEEQAYEFGINVLANVATSGRIGLYDQR